MTLYIPTLIIVMIVKKGGEIAGTDNNYYVNLFLGESEKTLHKVASELLQPQDVVYIENDFISSFLKKREQKR